MSHPPPARALLLLAWTSGCVAPSLKTAHSLDKYEFSTSATYTGVLTQYQGTLYTIDGDKSSHDPYLSTPELLEGIDIEGRLGLGHGVDIGMHGQVFPSGVDVKYAFIDERREDTPVSVAADLEVGIDQLWGPTARLGLLASSNQLLGRHVAFRPAINLYVMCGGMTYRSEIDDQTTFDPEWNYGFFDEPPNAWVRFQQTGLLVPIGFESAVRLSQRWGIGPTVSFAPWIPFYNQVNAADCDGCTVGAGELQPGQGALLVVGIRLTPWFVPEGRH